METHLNNGIVASSLFEKNRLHIGGHGTMWAMSALPVVASDKAPIMYGADMVHRAICQELSSVFPVVPIPWVAHKDFTAAPDRQQVVEASITVSQPLVETEAEEAEEAARDGGEEEDHMDIGQAKSEAAARLAEDESKRPKACR